MKVAFVGSFSTGKTTLAHLFAREWEYPLLPEVAREVVDTTGAGDLYAAGFLFGLTHGETLARCGELGSLCAAEVISHVGARPQRRLAELVASS